MEVTLEVTANSDISFWYKVSSEATYDYLRFYVDGGEVASWEGTVAWSQFTYPVSAGTRTFKWAYTKDYSVSDGDDSGWVDYIEFPTLAEPPAASATIDPASIDDTLAPDDVVMTSVNLGNVGDADLDHSTSVTYQDGPGTGWLSVTPSSGTVAPQGTVRLDIELDATGLAEDGYTADIIVATNDPANPTITIPVSMTVTTWVGVDEELPLATVFFGAVPNPFNPTTSLHFSLPRESHVDLKIYDVAGRLVREVVSGSRPAGPNEVRWDGKDSAGQEIASGTYFARLIVDEQIEIKSLTLVR